MNNNLVKEIAATQLRTDLPEFSTGDEVKVYIRIIENKKERVQVFQGVVLQRRGGNVSETFTVRKVSSGIGVEKTFPLHSPSITKIELVRRGKVRRNKIFYLRERSGKSARIKEIVNALGGEKVDLYQWSENPEELIANSLQPASVTKVLEIDVKNKTSRVVVPDDHLSLAIGKQGQNVRLAVQSCGWKIDIMPTSEAFEKGLIQILGL